MSSDNPDSVYADAFKAAAEGALVLTANRRLSRHLRGGFDAHQARRGLEVWPSAQILPFSAWLGQLWSEGLAALLEAATKEPSEIAGATAESSPKPPRHLLTESQARIVWERIIAKDLGRQQLLQPAAAARAASQARERLISWRLELSPEIARLTEEAAAFARWQAAFEAACAQAGWCTGADLPGIVGQWLADGLIHTPGQVLLAGFDQITPRQETLLEVIAATGTIITHLPMPSALAAPGNSALAAAGNTAPAPALRVACRDSEEEMQTAARWARRLLEADAESTIAIVVPDLAGAKAGLQRVFSEVLAPGAILPGAESALPFNLSHGAALAEYPLAREALFLLGLWREPLSFDAITRLLLSPYLAGAEEEGGARALLDEFLRRQGEPERPLSAIISAAGARDNISAAGTRANISAAGTRDNISAAGARESRQAPSPHHAPRLAGLLSSLKEQFDRFTGLRQSPSAWADAFSLLLGTLGWPGQLRLGSGERQTWDKLQEQFSALAGLDLVLPTISMGEALSRLSRLAQDAQFQPEGRPVRVQILGVLEAGGLTFDHLWVLGLHDEAWPRPPRPNPFLPAAWQREHRLPQSSAAVEADYARRVTARLLASAPDVVTSHALREGEQLRRPSRFIAYLPQVQAATLALSTVPSYWQVIQESGGLERISDSQAPPLAKGTTTSGGTRLFQDQAACPFRAFANHRLHARPLERPSHGLDPRERGNIVHRVLDLLWEKLESSSNLHALTPEALTSRVTDAVNGALVEFAKRLPATLKGNTLELERARLLRLILDYLENEKLRAPFTVQGREVQSHFEIGGIEVNTRADRIDRLEDGRHVVIDYKTGRASWRNWLGDRPDEPQLPLYCSSGGLDIAAVAFAQLRRGETRFQGLQAEAGILPLATRFDSIRPPPPGPEPPTRQAVLAQWKTVLENLAGEFREGMAQVQPKDPRSTCRYCELKPVCRIHELSAWDEDGEENGR